MQYPYVWFGMRTKGLAQSRTYPLVRCPRPVELMVGQWLVVLTGPTGQLEFENRLKRKINVVEISWNTVFLVSHRKYVSIYILIELIINN